LEEGSAKSFCGGGRCNKNQSTLN